jgi:hypothetical protein
LFEKYTQRLFETPVQAMLVPLERNRSARIQCVVRREKISVQRLQKKDTTHTMIEICGVLAVILEFACHAFEPGAIGGAAQFFEKFGAAAGAFDE